jgi:RNA-directed DNA polymerase
MSDRQPTRDELYERIRKSGKPQVVLEEMKRTGFWPATETQPTVQEALLNRETELHQQLNELSSKLGRMQDRDAALKMMRKERMAQALAQREETRRKRAQERFDKAKAWHERRQREVLYAGEGVSGGLNAKPSNAERLQQLGLPLLNTSNDLASAIGIALGELRFLTFTRKVSRISHYAQFRVAKKTGGERLISAPHQRLKRTQYWILDNVLKPLKVHDCAHGFVPLRSIKSNAQPHVGQAVVMNIDLKDFFPSVKLPRVKSLFRELGYSPAVATLMALLATQSPTEEVTVDGERLFVATGERALPQGAPTSPGITNLLARSLDRRLLGVAKQLGFSYTRYADDLTFSTSKEHLKNLAKLRWRVLKIVEAEGFTPHPKKQHVMRAHQRQEVTGLVVNRTLHVQRDDVRRLRAVIHQIEKRGPQGLHWNGNTNVIEAVKSYAAFVAQIDPARGRPLVERATALAQKYGVPQAKKPSEVSKYAFRNKSAKAEAPKPNWWQPAVVAAPIVEKTAQQVVEAKKEAKVEAKAAASGGRLGSGNSAGVATPVFGQAEAGNISSGDTQSQPQAPQAPAVGPSGWSFLSSVVCQFCLFYWAMRATKAPLLLAVGMFWIAYAIMSRKARWPLFLGVLAVAVGVFGFALK